MVQLQRCHPYEKIISIVLEDSDVKVGICLECLHASLSSSMERFHMEDLDSHGLGITNLWNCNLHQLLLL